MAREHKTKETDEAMKKTGLRPNRKNHALNRLFLGIGRTLEKATATPFNLTAAPTS